MTDPTKQPPPPSSGSGAAVCTRCNDTHEMPARDSYGEERGDMWPCTGCPVPCEECRFGAFCRTTPCNCSCHGAPPPQPAPEPGPEPASPLPWMLDVVDGECFTHRLLGEDGLIVAEFEEYGDLVYAQHACNTLPTALAQISAAQERIAELEAEVSKLRRQADEVDEAFADGRMHYNDAPEGTDPNTLTLAEIREGAKRASAQFETWPKWKREVSEPSDATEVGRVKARLCAHDWDVEESPADCVDGMAKRIAELEARLRDVRRLANRTCGAREWVAIRDAIDTPGDPTP